MLAVLLTRDRLDLTVLHDRNPVFVKLADGSIRNGYTVRILNMKAEPRDFRLDLKDLPGATMTMAGSDAAPASSITVSVEPDDLRTMKIFVRADPRTVSGSTASFRFEVNEVGGPETASTDANFETPGEGS